MIEFLKPYQSPRARSVYRRMNYVPIPFELRWKAIVLVMRGGEWMTITQIQKATKFKRKRVRNLMKIGMKYGVIEKTKEKEVTYVPTKREWTWRKDRGNGLGVLTRARHYYRMDMSKLKITVVEGEDER